MLRFMSICFRDFENFDDFVARVCVTLWTMYIHASLFGDCDDEVHAINVQFNFHVLDHHLLSDKMHWHLLFEEKVLSCDVEWLYWNWSLSAYEFSKWFN